MLGLPGRPAMQQCSGCWSHPCPTAAAAIRDVGTCGLGRLPARSAAVPSLAASPGAFAPAGFLAYTLVAVAATLHLIFRVSLDAQTSNVLVYVAICSIVGSLSGAACT